MSVICIIGVSSSPHLGPHQGPSPQGVMSDRSLHVRSLPPITGFQSNIYEVYMEPFPFVSFCPIVICMLNQEMHARKIAWNNKKTHGYSS